MAANHISAVPPTAILFASTTCGYSSQSPLPLPSCFHKQRHELLGDKYAILHIRLGIVLLWFYENVVVPAQVDNPTVPWSSSSQVPHLERLQSKLVLCSEYANALLAGVAHHSRAPASSHPRRPCRVPHQQE